LERKREETEADGIGRRTENDRMDKVIEFVESKSTKIGLLK
jgi:hypothetical protein